MIWHRTQSGETADRLGAHVRIGKIPMPSAQLNDGQHNIAIGSVQLVMSVGLLRRREGAMQITPCARHPDSFDSQLLKGAAGRAVEAPVDVVQCVCMDVPRTSHSGSWLARATPGRART